MHGVTARLGLRLPSAALHSTGYVSARVSGVLSVLVAFLGARATDGSGWGSDWMSAQIGLDLRLVASAPLHVWCRVGPSRVFWTTAFQSLGKARTRRHLSWALSAVFFPAVVLSLLAWGAFASLNVRSSVPAGWFPL